MSRAHATAVATALTTAGLRVYVGGAPANPTYPYVALYTDAGAAQQSSLTMAADHYVHTFQTTAVATSDLDGKAHEQALWVAEKVRTALAGRRLTVTGWNNARIEHIASSPVQADYDAPTNVRHKVDQWRYVATPA